MQIFAISSFASAFKGIQATLTSAMPSKLDYFLLAPKRCGQNVALFM